MDTGRSRNFLGLPVTYENIFYDLCSNDTIESNFFSYGSTLRVYKLRCMHIVFFNFL